MGSNIGGGTLTSFADTSLLMGKQKVSPIAGWDEVESQLEAWAMFCTLFLGDNGVHPAPYTHVKRRDRKSVVSHVFQHM